MIVETVRKTGFIVTNAGVSMLVRPWRGSIVRPIVWPERVGFKATSMY